MGNDQNQQHAHSPTDSTTREKSSLDQQGDPNESDQQSQSSSTISREGDREVSGS